MKTVFSSHAQCAHVWAQQTQSEGRSGPLYFDGPAIYSYGRHYCIARFTDAVTATGARVVLVNVLFNATGSARTTQDKHKPAVLAALHGLPVYMVHVPGASANHADNLRYFRERFNSHVAAAARAQTYAQSNIEAAEQIRDMAAVYVQAFGLELPAFPNISTDLLCTSAMHFCDARELGFTAAGISG